MPSYYAKRTDNASQANVPTIDGMSSSLLVNAGTFFYFFFPGAAASQIGDMTIDLKNAVTPANDTTISLTSDYIYSGGNITMVNGSDATTDVLGTPFQTVESALGSEPELIYATSVTSATWGITTQSGFWIPGPWTSYELVWPVSWTPTIYETHYRTWYRKRTCWPYGFSWIVLSVAYSGVPCPF